MATKENSGANRPRRPQKPQPRNTAPEVVVTQPKPFVRRRLLMRLLTILAVVIAIGMGLSIFFKVDTITVTGAQKYSEWTVSQASGLEKGDSLLFFGRAGAAGKIIRQLPYVKSVRFRIDLPGTVNIIIEESPVAYTVADSKGKPWLITSEGRVVEQTDAAAAAKIIGVTLLDPKVGELAVAAETATDAIVTTTGADRLQAALEICALLEKNEFLGTVASVDVTSLQAIELWYGQQYQIKLGNTERLDYKIAAVRQAIGQMSNYHTGVLDASFTAFKDSVGYMPFTE